MGKKYLTVGKDHKEIINRLIELLEEDKFEIVSTSRAESTYGYSEVEFSLITPEGIDCSINCIKPYKVE